MATFQLPQLQGRIQFSLDGLQGFLLARGEVALQDRVHRIAHQYARHLRSQCSLYHFGLSTLLVVVHLVWTRVFKAPLYEVH